MEHCALVAASRYAPATNGVNPMDNPRETSPMKQKRGSASSWLSLRTINVRRTHCLHHALAWLVVVVFALVAGK